MNKNNNPSGGRSNKSSTAKSRPSTSSAGAKSGTKRPATSAGSSKGGKSITISKNGKKGEEEASAKRKFYPFKEKVKKGDPMPKMNDDEIRLNKYLSNAGICSRREADVLITSGVVSINGKIVTELGHKVLPTDKVEYDDAIVNPEKKRYVLLNKPKDFITTMDDPWGRRTVMSLVIKACKERVFPVGRLDRATTGLLLFTNDGDLAKKLTHPSHVVTKMYHVETDRPMQQADIDKLIKGIDLEDGKIKVDKFELVEGKGNYEAGIEIHSGKNRIVRRMMEAIGYKVVKLDRVVFAGLTKKDLPRGHYRHLTEKEVAFLRMN